MRILHLSLMLLFLAPLNINLCAADNFYPDGAYYEEASENAENDKGDDKKDDEKKEDEKKETSPHSFKGYVSFMSDYRFRGISQTMRQPAIQGGLTYSHTSGFYLGTFGSNADGTCNYYNNTSMEWDFFSGWKNKLCTLYCKDLNYDIGVIYYYYPGGESFSPHPVRFNTVEYYVELSYDWISVRYWQTLSNYFGFCSRYTPFNWHSGHADSPNGSTRGSVYVEANINYEICPTWSLQLHLGSQYIRHYHHMSYTDWRTTLSKEFEWFTVFGSYVGTDANSHYYTVPDHAFHPQFRSLTAQGFVVGLTRTL